MAKAKVITTPNSSVKLGRPGLTPESRQNQLIALAYDLAEQQLRDGTASSQVITQFLKMGTEQAQLEIEKMKQETELIKAKREAARTNEELKAMYKEALDAMRVYSGNGEPDDY